MERLVVVITLFGALLLVIGVVSVVNPMTQLGIRTRGKALILLSLGLVLFASGPVLQTLTTTLPSQARQQPDRPARGELKGDDTQTRLCRLIEEVFQGHTNVSHQSRLRECTVSMENGAYRVSIAFNADDRLTASMTREGIEDAMRRAYAALSTSGVRLHRVTIGAYLTLLRPSGSLEDVRVFETRLDHPTDLTRLEDQGDVLDVDSRWDVTKLHPDLK